MSHPGERRVPTVRGRASVDQGRDGNVVKPDNVGLEPLHTLGDARTGSRYGRMLRVESPWLPASMR